MLSFLRFFALVGVICTAAVMVAPAAADDEASREALGRAVHAYNSGSMQSAYEILSSAIEAGGKDPRLYYFRGLANLRLGRESEAKGDFQVGADQEARDTVSQTDIARSLERVQGPARLKLESFRSAARVALAREREQRRLLRYEQIRRAAPAAGTDGAAEKENLPAPQKPAAGEDPFGASTPAEKKTDDDPFGS